MLKKMFLIVLMVPSITIAMDEVHRCIIEESHRYENDDEMLCYFAKKDLFIECCVQASTTHTPSIQELITNSDSPYVLMTPRDLFVRLLKNMPVQADANKENFPPYYTTTLNGIKTHLVIQKVSQFPFAVEPGIGYKKPERQSVPEQLSTPIEIREYDFDLNPEWCVFPPALQRFKRDYTPAPITSKTLAERHPDIVGFELSSEDFATEHAAHHKKVVALFKALIQ
jgi:hypothetical protein